MTSPTATDSIQKTITVKASQQRAFRVFTEELDSWWPRTHHIGKSPMTKTVLQGELGGRCYSEQADGSECDWGRIVLWEPPRRFVMAWLINTQWQPEPDASKCSEVEVNFTPQPDGSTRVDLEHRRFSRMGPDGEKMREAVASPGGWGSLLEMFAKKAEEGAA